MSYTYYGDLLGVSGYYKLSPDTAYNRLNDFYNTTFSHFSEYCRRKHDVEISMFSDSILIWGNDATSILEKLQSLYYRLIQKGLFLRGAIVEGKLDFDHRLTLENFKKKLPTDNTLARAVGLENTQKGARLMIENSLANLIMRNHSDWLTHEGYFQNLKREITINSIFRRICPTPDNRTYECLYLWVKNSGYPKHEKKIQSIKAKLTELPHMLSDEISIHHKATLELLNRCQVRRQFTENCFNE